MRHLIFIAALGFSLLAQCAESSKVNLDDQLRAAITSYRSGDSAKALTVLNATIKDHPKAAIAWAHRSQVHSDLGKYAAAATDADTAVKLEPEAAELHQLLGEAHFRNVNMEASINSFDEFIRLRPSREPHHWQRGISHYYAGQYANGRKQFTLHQTVNGSDVENAVFHFICTARAIDLKTAQKELIPISGDSRIPMAQIHKLFAGKMSVKEVMAAATGGESMSPAARTRAAFYANYYIGLYYESHGEPGKAKNHILKAAKSADQNGYMGDCARVHAALIERADQKNKANPKKAAARPNILWFVVDDMSANFSCYGERLIETPAVDRLASEGVRFTRAYATSPVCSTFRSALITGMYQTSIGAHHHRSGRGEHRIQLPDGVRPVPELFQEAGYWTCNGSGLPDRDKSGKLTNKQRAGKTDYNFDWNRKMYDSHDWAGREDAQPFFMQVQLHGGKMRGSSVAQYAAFEERANQELGLVTKPDSVRLPPYYPRDRVLLRDWSTYLDTVRLTDAHVGRVINRLEKEGLLENTLVVFFTDHGISHARGKQFLYDEGAHIPLIISGPGAPRGATRTDLVEHIDVAALSLAAAGIEIPAKMQGRDILAEDHEPKAAVFAARDRCGEAADHIRSVRTGRYLYIRNFLPLRPHLQPSQYKDSKIIVQRLRELHASGGLNDVSTKLLFSPTRPREELYLYGKDRWQVRNLAADPMHAKALKQHRKRLKKWIEESGDMGPESPEIYALEMSDELNAMNKKSERFKTFGRNVEMYKRWASEGK